MLLPALGVRSVFCSLVCLHVVYICDITEHERSKEWFITIRGSMDIACQENYGGWSTVQNTLTPGRRGTPAPATDHNDSIHSESKVESTP